MSRTHQIKETSPFSLQDSSIFKVEIPNAVSSSLLGGSSVFGRNLLDSLRYNNVISAANFYFPGSYNVLTNPLTYPDNGDTESWLYSLTQKGLAKTIPLNENSPYEFITKGSSELLRQYWLDSSMVSAEKIGGSHVSLTNYEKIADLRHRYSFPEEVSSFLLKKEVLIHFLDKAIVELISRFPKATFVLELKEDPEILGWRTLYLKIICSPSNPEEFEKDFENFLLNWMFLQSTEVKVLVTIVNKIH